MLHCVGGNPCTGSEVGQVPYGLLLIEVCDTNPACVPALFELEMEFPGACVLETSCLSQCDLCAAAPYVLLDGEIVTAPVVEDLLAAVRARISRLLQDIG